MDGQLDELPNKSLQNPMTVSFLSEVSSLSKAYTGTPLMDNWNAVAGGNPEIGVTGKYELGKRNNRVDRLNKFCTQKTVCYYKCTV